MLETILLSMFLLFGVEAQQGFDMSDEDFAAYIQVHDDFREKHGDSFGKGCVNGAVVAAVAGAGFQGLCIGCVAVGAGNVVQDVLYPPTNEKADRAYQQQQQQ